MRMKREAALFIKHALDRVIASVAIVGLAPVLLPIAILIKLDSDGPVFFRQERVGHLGRPFRMYKFRSMVHNAEQLAGGYITRLDSPMVTRTGRVLRRTSL